jgi:hypothetical protein
MATSLRDRLFGRTQPAAKAAPGTPPGPQRGAAPAGPPPLPSGADGDLAALIAAVAPSAGASRSAQPPADGDGPSGAAVALDTATGVDLPAGGYEASVAAPFDPPTRTRGGRPGLDLPNDFRDRLSAASATGLPASDRLGNGLPRGSGVLGQRGSTATSRSSVTTRSSIGTRSTVPSRGPGSGGQASSVLGSRGGGAPTLSTVDQLKVSLHRRLIDRLDLAALERIDDEAVLVGQIRQAVGEFLRAEQTPLSASEREEVVEQIVYEVTGLGPLEPLFRDPTISDILVNGPKDCYVERRGKLQRVAVTFRDDAHLLTVIDRIVSRVGRRVDESSPMVDARLPDGSRVNAIIPPLALDGAVLSIRRFGSQITAQQLVEKGAMTPTMLELLAGCVHAKLNIIISGGTGSGKTTMLNALSSFIPTPSAW